MGSFLLSSSFSLLLLSSLSLSRWPGPDWFQLAECQVRQRVEEQLRLLFFTRLSPGASNKTGRVRAACKCVWLFAHSNCLTQWPEERKTRLFSVSDSCKSKRITSSIINSHPLHDSLLTSGCILCSGRGGKKHDSVSHSSPWQQVLLICASERRWGSPHIHYLHYLPTNTSRLGHKVHQLTWTCIYNVP